MNVTVTLLSKRFQKNHFERLVAALQLDAYTCHQRTVCPAAEALLILLRRLAYPNRWCELTKLFGRAEPELSMIFNEVCIMFNWYKNLHSCQEGSNKGYVQVPMTPVMGCKNWESNRWHFILRAPICFFTYNTPRTNSGCVPLQFLFQCCSLQFKPFRIKGPFFINFQLTSFNVMG